VNRGHERLPELIRQTARGETMRQPQAMHVAHIAGADSIPERPRQPDISETPNTGIVNSVRSRVDSVRQLPLEPIADSDLASVPALAFDGHRER
jgi:hypothetical protein